MIVDQIGVLIVLLLLSGFFSAAETALFSISRAKARHIAKEKGLTNALIKKMKDDPHRLLSTILIGNNLVNVSAAALATSITIELVTSNAVGIATGIMTGVSRDFAVRFSFLLSIPIILGSIAHSLPAFRVQMTYESDLKILWLGFAVAAVSGYLAIRFMLRFLATRTFHPFVVYLWIIGLLCIAS